MDKQALQQSKEYHLRREEARREAREQLRQERYRQARDAIRRLAPNYLALRAVFLFGSIVRSGSYTRESDIDVAVACDDLAEESQFWRALETELDHNIDLRSYRGGVAWAVDTYGECVYAREVPDP